MILIAPQRPLTAKYVRVYGAIAKKEWDCCIYCVEVLQGAAAK